MRQAAALPFVPLETGLQVLLITSRKSGRWILPKGSVKRGEGLPEAAAREAQEEAGVVGEIQPKPIGEFTYLKKMPQGYRVGCHVFVYPLLVREQHLDWPERDQREFRWVSIADAVVLVSDRGLMRVLRNLSKKDNYTTF